MHLSYQDIKDSCDSDPLWYDENGVPRYCQFDPDEAAMYAKYVAHLHIACQYCGKLFEVSQTTKLMELAQLPSREAAEAGKVGPWDPVGDFHYGDPPNHGCVGDSMNSIPLEILGFWEDISMSAGVLTYGKQLRPEYVFTIPAGQRMVEEIGTNG